MVAEVLTKQDSKKEALDEIVRGGIFLHSLDEKKYCSIIKVENISRKWRKINYIWFGTPLPC